MSIAAIINPAIRRSWDSSSSLLCLQDEELVELAQTGCRTASERVMSLYGPLVRHIAARYFLVGAEHEDVVQEGFVGLCNAIRNFRAASDRCFHTFAFICVTRQIQSAVRAAGRAKHATLNGAEPLPNDDSSADRSLAEKAAVLSTKEDVDTLMSRYCVGLTPFESAVLQGIAEGQSYSDISKLLSCPLKSVDNGIQRAKRKILIKQSA